MRNQWFLVGAVFLLLSIDVASSYKVWRLARANGNFAFCLYSKAIKDAAGENVFFSPFSISTALSMTYAGARGKTAYEMCLVLGFCHLTFNVHASFLNTLASLNWAQGHYTLAVANRLFLQNGFSIRQSYVHQMAKYYYAGVQEIDFSSGGAAGTINNWVKKNTNNMIDDLVSPSMVADALLVLVNAIYFKGTWSCPFNEDDTVEHIDFHVPNSSPEMVKMMTQTARFRYSMNHHLRCQILEMPYKGGRLAMYILLPRDKDGLAALESKITFNSVTWALALLKKRRVSVAIPVFKIDAGFNLKKLLMTMGMTRIFSKNADLSGITNTGGLYVNNAVHKAVIGVDEVGTEASAATGQSTMLLVNFLTQDFMADHPFLFLIRDNLTGSILFVGRLVRPQ